MTPYQSEMFMMKVLFFVTAIFLLCTGRLRAEETWVYKTDNCNQVQQFIKK